MTDHLTASERHLLVRLAEGLEEEGFHCLAGVFRKEYEKTLAEHKASTDALDLSKFAATEPEQPTGARARNRLIADIIDMRNTIEKHADAVHWTEKKNFVLGLIDDLLKKQAQP